MSWMPTLADIPDWTIGSANAVAELHSLEEDLSKELSKTTGDAERLLSTAYGLLVQMHDMAWALLGRQAAMHTLESYGFTALRDADAEARSVFKWAFDNVTRPNLVDEPALQLALRLRLARTVNPAENQIHDQLSQGASALLEAASSVRGLMDLKSSAGQLAPQLDWDPLWQRLTALLKAIDHELAATNAAEAEA